MKNNFFGPIGQVADKIENNFYFNNYRQERKASIVDIETEEYIEDAVIVTDEEQNNDLNAPPSFEMPKSVKECFRFASEFVKEQVDVIIKDFYLNKPVNLAIIERTLYDHNILQNSNRHTLFICALIDWGILSEDIDIRKTANGMATKFKNLPLKGYKQWNDDHLNDRTLCNNIGKKLPESMKYNRNE